ncbi:MAG: tetratricopeptide repeat protein [Candidatus Obscuribacterales bacterium]|nr:tetratricopeptide repeat protein [Candidatus Obscuribacterales bacterium]
MLCLFASVQLYLPAVSAGQTEVLIQAAQEDFDLRDFESAENTLLEALANQEQDSLSYTICLQNLALLEYYNFNYRKAEGLYREAIENAEVLCGPNSKVVANSLYGLSRCLRHQHRFAEAQTCINRILKIRSKVYGNEHSLIAKSLMDLAVNYQRQGKCAEAKPLFEKAISLHEKHLGKNSQELLPLLLCYQASLKQAGDQPGLNKLGEKIKELSQSQKQIRNCRLAQLRSFEEDGSGWQSSALL